MAPLTRDQYPPAPLTGKCVTDTVIPNINILLEGAFPMVFRFCLFHVNVAGVLIACFS